MEHTIIGYDIRIAKDTAAASWDDSRRKEYLLRTDVQCPLSVDIDVWPSVFGLEAGQHSDGKVLIARPTIRQEALGLWENSEEMVSRFQSADDLLIKRRACAICVTVLSGEGSESPFLKSWTSVLGLASHPKPTQASWDFLGFDVADRNLLSGLSNCGFDQSESDALRPSWANKLNDEGLFSEEQDVVAFRALSDKRCREHNPFDIFGLFSIPLSTVT